MRNIILGWCCLLLAGVSLPAYAQVKTDEEIEVMLLNAQYGDVLAAVAQLGPKKTVALEHKTVEALIRMGNYNRAQNLLDSIARQPVTARSTIDMGTTQMNLGFLYLMQGRNDLSQEALHNALTKLNDNDAPLEWSKATTYLGLVYLNTGKVTQSEEQMQAALRVRERYLAQHAGKIPKAYEEFLAASYNDLGLVYTQIDKDKALMYYEKALELYQKLHGNEHPKIAISNTNIGYLNSALEFYGDAINNFEDALKIWNKVSTGPHASKAFVLLNLGETYMRMANLKLAREYYQQALDMYSSTHGGKHPDVARVETALGNLDMDNRKYNQALQHYQNALKSNVSDFNSDDITTNPTPKNFYDGNVLLYALMFKAQALEEQYFEKSLKLDDLRLALKTLQVCDTLIDRLRQQINNENDKLILGGIATEIYADGVRIAYEAAQGAFRKEHFNALAFYFAEKSKAAVLLEAISDTQAKSFAGIPHNLLEEERDLKSAISLCTQKLAQKPEPAEEKRLRELSFTLHRKYETFVKKLETEFPEYYNLKFNTTSPSIAQIQSKLDSKTMLLSYFNDEKTRATKQNKLYIFQITKDNYTVTQKSLPADFDKYVTGLRNGLFYQEENIYIHTASALSPLLLPNRIPAKIHDLVILPTGRLSVMPFEALFLKPARNTTGYAALPYVLKQYNVRYEFSSGLILQKSQKPSMDNASIFLCAPVQFPGKDFLAALPGTEAEVFDISKLFASKNFKAAAYTHLEADEKLIKSGNLKQYSLLHFATHGVVDENNPELSRIFLQASASTEDGDLFAGEIYNLELNANLVTLSACQTGLGKISKGEGVIGLSRALVYAGARNCMVSFWSVADESTATLMKEFYKLLLDNSGNNMSHNLRSAKIALMQNPQYAAPYYWAPFILIGF